MSYEHDRFFDLSIDLLCIAGADGCFKRLNPAWERALGFSREELCSKPFIEFVHPDDRARTQDVMERLSRGQPAINFENRYRCRDGSYRWLTWITPAPEDDPPIFYAAARDITELKQMEEALRRANNELEQHVVQRTQELAATNAALRVAESWQRALIDSIQGIVWECDARTWKFSFVSPQAERVLGYPVRHWLDEPDFWQTHIHPDDRDWVMDYCLASSREKHKYSFEYRLIAADGRTVWLQDIVTVERDEHGPAILRGIMVDITERKQAEAAVRESEERLRQAIRAGNIGTFDHDHHSDTIYWSPEHRRMYGLGLEEPVTLAKYLQHVHAEDRDRITEAVQRAHDPTGDGLFDMEHRIIDRHGATHWLFTRSRTHFEGEGRARHKVRTTGAVVDITERKQAAAALLESEEQLRKMLEEREQLSLDLHDNIIQSIYATGMSLEECRYLFHEDPQAADKKLEHAVASLNRVISDVRIYIMWDEHEAISGQQFCAKLAELAVTMESVQGIHFSLDLAVEAAQRLTPREALHILHIVQEAMSNSLRHSQSRSGLVSLQLHGGRVRLEIRDDGVGFNLEEALGRGHGLQNMTARAQKLGAHLQIISKPGLGVQMVVELPSEGQHARASS